MEGQDAKCCGNVLCSSGHCCAVQCYPGDPLGLSIRLVALVVGVGCRAGVSGLLGCHHLFYSVVCTSGMAPEVLTSLFHATVKKVVVLLSP